MSQCPHCESYHCNKCGKAIKEGWTHTVIPEAFATWEMYPTLEIDLCEDCDDMECAQAIGEIIDSRNFEPETPTLTLVDKEKP